MNVSSIRRQQRAAVTNDGIERKEKNYETHQRPQLPLPSVSLSPFCKLSVKTLSEMEV